MTTDTPVTGRYRVVPQHPFGVHVIADGDADAWELPADEIHSLTVQHRVVVLRGFRRLEGEQFPRWAARLGQPLRWAFGEVNELRVDDTKKNYLYSDGDVPLHWDGAFAGAIPRYIVFQCRDAPPREAGGETTFVDTVGLLRATPPERVAEWRSTACTYTTEKVVHYGGSIVQTVLARHPISGEETIRFAEPVRDLNPVAVAVVGQAPAASDAFVAAMAHELAAPEHLLEHAWEPGDIVVADNHALLHGRRAFRGTEQRHLERVNILGPGSEDAAPAHERRHLLRDLLRIRRVEFILAEIPIIAIPLVVAGAEWNVLRTGAFWAVAALFFLLFNFGDMVNCLADRELDAVYKTHLASAVGRLGVASVTRQIVASALGALGLALALAVGLDRPLVVPLVIVGLALGAAYSLPPVRLKGRGLLQLGCLWAIIFVGPMVLVTQLVSDTPSLAVLVIAATYGATQMGVILVNTAEDFPEDEAAGIRTTIVALGPPGGMLLAVGLVAVGGAVLTAALATWGIDDGAPPVSVVALVPLLLASVAIARRIHRVARAIRGVDTGTAATEIRRVARFVPMAIAAVAWSTLAGALVMRALA